MFKRESSIRFFFNGIVNIRNRSIMPHLISIDHVIKANHFPPINCRCLPCIRGFSTLETSGFSCNTRFGISHKNRRFLTLQNCFDSNKKIKAQALAPNSQLRQDLEIGLRKEHTVAKTANGRGSCQERNPLGLPENGKIVVAVDVDEVLGNFVSAINRFIADRYALNHSVSEYHVYEFFKIWNCSRDEADIRVHEFFKTHYFKKGIHPLPGAQQTLHRLSRTCNLSVVTSRQNVIKDHTLQWIEEHFPGLFQEIHFGNHFALDGESKPKSEICRSLDAKVLIDDNPRYALECAEAGIKVLLFDYQNSYPWCKVDSVNLHPLVTKVHNWEEVEHQLVSLIVS